MSNEFELIVKSDHTSELMGEALKRRMAKVTRAMAFRCQAYTQANIQANGTIDTGAYLNGIYVQVPGQDDYDKGAGQVESRRPGHAVPHESALDESGMDAAVVCAANYGWILEFGGEKRRAYPAMIPAHDKATAELEKVAALLLLEGLEGIG